MRIERLSDLLALLTFVVNASATTFPVTLSLTAPSSQQTLARSLVSISIEGGCNGLLRSLTAFKQSLSPLCARQQRIANLESLML